MSRFDSAARGPRTLVCSPFQNSNMEWTLVDKMEKSIGRVTKKELQIGGGGGFAVAAADLSGDTKLGI